MEFAEMKVIWDSQNEEPLYAMNEAALHAIVQRRTEEWARSRTRCFLTEITIGLICGALMLVCAVVLAFGDPASLRVLSWIKVRVSPWDSLALFAAGGLWFFYAAAMYLARRRQQRREEAFESSLRGDLERALDQTRFQMNLARDIVWWGLLPIWVAGGLWVLTLCHLVAAPLSAYLLMGIFIAGSLVFVVAGKQRSITKRFRPRQDELESLRAKLADAQP